MKLRASNPSTTGLEKSYLSSSYSALATSITIRNNDRFAASQKILVGELGHERSEIVTINTVTTPGTVFTLTGTGLVFPHDADTPVYVLKYDKVRFYRSTTGIDGRKVNEGVLEVVESAREKIANTATQKLLESLEFFVPATLDQKELPGAALKLASVVEKVQAGFNPTDKNGPRFIVFSPRMKAEEAFDIIEVHE